MYCVEWHGVVRSPAWCRLTAKANDDSLYEVSTASDEAMGCDMAFILGVIFFVVVVGALDARLPWPAPRSRGSQP